MVSCSSNKSQPTFAEAHDTFKTKLVRQDNDQNEIPEPPKGVFDLVRYPSKVGDLAAYVSSDPSDGQKHPMIIWIVGGWGNGIDEFPWSYAAWDNDQTGSAFWKAGVLTMYPSFRGGSGNPGYYEALFGEIDEVGIDFSYPFQWKIEDISVNEDLSLVMYSNGQEDNVWDMSTVYINAYTSEEPNYVSKFEEFFEAQDYNIQEIDIDGYSCLEANGIEKQEDNNRYRNKILLIQKDNSFVEFSFYIHESYGKSAEPLFLAMIDSIKLH